MNIRIKNKLLINYYLKIKRDAQEDPILNYDK